MSSVKKSSRLKLIIVVAVLAVAAGLWWWIQQTDKDDGQLLLYGNVDIREPLNNSPLFAIIAASTIF